MFCVELWKSRKQRLLPVRIPSGVLPESPPMILSERSPFSIYSVFVPRIPFPSAFQHHCITVWIVDCSDPLQSVNLFAMFFLVVVALPVTSANAFFVGFVISLDPGLVVLPPESCSFSVSHHHHTRLLLLVLTWLASVPASPTAAFAPTSLARSGPQFQMSLRTA